MFNHMGLGLGPDGTRSAADKIKKEVTLKSETWKENLEVKDPF